MNPAIIIEGISKKFYFGNAPQSSTLRNVTAFILGRQQQKEFLALDDVSFKVESGEIIGLIGRNGSGKSTLLRLIAEIYQADKGKILTTGKLVYVTGLGKGLRKGLTMRENIFLGAALMGLNERQTQKVFKDIVDFSGLYEFLDGKLDNLSTGMAARLAFSISTYCVKHQNPDVLLLDEVFSAGGDIDFNTKALTKMEDLVKGGATVVLVSHNLDIIKKYCRRTVWLDKGRIVSLGETKDIVQAYQDSAKNVASKY